MRNLLAFLTTTALGGVLFLLPLIVVGALIGQAVPIVMAIAEVLKQVLPFRSPGGVALLIGLSIVVLLLLCFAAGLLARKSWGKKLSAWFERNLLLLFPRYAVIREQMAGTVGGEAVHMTPVLIELAGAHRVGFEVERSSTAATVYLPGSPDPWTGSVAFVKPAQLRPLGTDFPTALATFEKLGRDALPLLSLATGDSKSSAEAP